MFLAKKTKVDFLHPQFGFHNNNNLKLDFKPFWMLPGGIYTSLFRHQMQTALAHTVTWPSFKNHFRNKGTPLKCAVYCTLSYCHLCIRIYHNFFSYFQHQVVFCYTFITMVAYKTLISIAMNNMDSIKTQIFSVYFGGPELSQFKFLARQRLALYLSRVDVKSRLASEEWEENSCTQWHQSDPPFDVSVCYRLVSMHDEKCIVGGGSTR